MASGLCYHRFSVVAPGAEHSETWTVTFAAQINPVGETNTNYGVQKDQVFPTNNKDFVVDFLFVPIFEPQFVSSISIFCIKQNNTFWMLMSWGKASKVLVNQCYQSWRLPLQQDPSSLLSSVACQETKALTFNLVWRPKLWAHQNSDSISRILNEAQVHGVNCSHPFSFTHCQILFRTFKLFAWKTCNIL